MVFAHLVSRYLKVPKIHEGGEGDGDEALLTPDGVRLVVWFAAGA